jgi:DNA (cytosine-5)-methyltransferase 1
MLDATREAFASTGKPWVLENVPGAPMRKDLVLCGGMFGLRTYRHRWFESNVPLAAPEHPKHVIRASSKGRRNNWDAGLHATVTGDIGTYVGREAMQIDWMIGDELSQAIPPPYTEYIGRQLIERMT